MSVRPDQHSSRIRRSKYAPLYDYLKASRNEVMTLSLEEIEEILGFALTASAGTSGWWANATSTKNRAQTSSWLEAGYEAAARDGYVTFKRARARL